MKLVMQYILENPIFIALFSLIFLAKLFVTVRKHSFSPETYQNLKDRIHSWFYIVLSLFIALSQRNVFFIYFGFVMFLGLKEYFSLIELRKSDRYLIFFLYLTIPFEMYLIDIQWYDLFIIFVPVYVFFLVAIVLTLQQKVEGILKTSATIFWGVMICVYGLGHISYLYNFSIPQVDAVGRELILYVLLLTEGNDIFQYIWGKSLGKRKIIPLVSPNKTWEGFLGGVFSTIFLAIMLGIHFFDFPIHYLFLFGLEISIFGFLGDVSISAVKRDLGIKDTSHLIPGHGGILDRLDSLIFVSLLFFHTIYYLYY
ncbi:phosphatidate cytidylyltransferase [Fusobacterium necrophorum]|uniref:phosphatidate cytidylyltransferase n=1 Tax=Fusobacterium necrophorum TaxID=859 RepID=UPI00254BB04A|nr:phosphatidate cytidylyltransferase [Fusobacterium necrophorum]MDK4500755.1 phosphatidate cytidylyltransferase [Fusobacterium necrophorum]